MPNNLSVSDILDINFNELKGKETKQNVFLIKFEGEEFRFFHKNVSKFSHKK